MKAIDRVTEHFSKQDIRMMEVPQWGDENGPLKIYASPMTLSEKNKLFKMAKDDDVALLAYVLIMKAKDEQGNKLFTIADKKTLMDKADPDIVADVSRWIMGADGDEDEDNNFLSD